jgi:hypothetical protein
MWLHHVLYKTNSTRTGVICILYTVVCTRIYAYTYRLTRTGVIRVYTYLHVYVHEHIHIYTNTYTYRHIYINVYTNIFVYNMLLHLYEKNYQYEP